MEFGREAISGYFSSASGALVICHLTTDRTVFEARGQVGSRCAAGIAIYAKFYPQTLTQQFLSTADDTSAHRNDLNYSSAYPPKGAVSTLPRVVDAFFGHKAAWPCERVGTTVLPYPTILRGASSNQRHCVQE